jgi:hypothetical protein
MTEFEKKGNKVAAEIEKICKKYDCQLGVWLTWRDLAHNLQKMQDTPGFDEAQFGLQIRFENKDNGGDSN